MNIRLVGGVHDGLLVDWLGRDHHILMPQPIEPSTSAEYRDLRTKRAQREFNSQFKIDRYRVDPSTMEAYIE